MEVLALQDLLGQLIVLVLIAVKAFALVSASTFSAEAYQAGGKLTKPSWVGILAVGLVAQLLLTGSPMSLITLAFTIAALVYLADVRPALAGLTRR